jgi:hypothetical protein
LLAGFVFLHFAGTIRSVLGSAEATAGGSVRLARVAFAGAITGITGITIADRRPLVRRVTRLARG